MALEPEPLRIGGRMKNALIADLVHEADDIEEADHYLLEGVSNDEYVWTEHLGRQIGMRHTNGYGVHDTLMVLLRQLNEWVNDVPIGADARACSSLAEMAIKHINPSEVEEMLFSGGPNWLSQQIGDGVRLDRLPQEYKRLLTKAVTSGLGGMLQRWDSWKIHRMSDLWREAKDREAERQLAAREELAARPPAPRPMQDGKPIPPPPGQRIKPDVPSGFSPPSRDWRPGYK